MREARFDGKADGGAVFTVYHDVGEGGNAYDLDADGRKKPARNGDGFDGLVPGARANGLNLDASAVFDHAGDGTRHRRGR